MRYIQAVPKLACTNLNLNRGALDYINKNKIIFLYTKPMYNLHVNGWFMICIVKFK